MTRTTPSEPLKPSTGELSAIIGMLSAIDRNQCPQSIGTPVRNPRNPHPGRVAAMEQRLNAMLQAVNIVQPALQNFYSTLSDEQKARFNALGAPQS